MNTGQVIVYTLKVDLKHELLEVERLGRTENPGEFQAIFNDICKDLDQLGNKYREMYMKMFQENDTPFRVYGGELERKP